MPTELIEMADLVTEMRWSSIHSAPA